MNNQRRQAISKIVSELEDIKDRLETLRDEEQESFDNMPEGLQQSERGQASENAAGDLSEACDSIDSVLSNLGNIE